ncbi:MAG: diaminopimelate decarboxylase [Bacteroidetes bacterium]|nr:diaminopimelate decarboxylase [Bacteroidota bacterium]MBU2586173.1 diaminopimelate decarboxylase [Bacteroidota bacterium]
MQFENYSYKNNELFCEKVSLNSIASVVGTPFYVYSKKSLVDRFHEFKASFNELDHQIFFAVKSNSNLNVMKLFYSLGAGLDVNSGGELYRALKIGADPKKLLFTGVGKTEDEILLGLRNDIFLFKAESIQEIELMNKLAASENKKARIAIRVNPNVDPRTHPYITTGLYESKFGIDEGAAFEAFQFASKLSNIVVVGIDMHLGSQITKLSVYQDAIKIINRMIQKLRESGIHLTHFDIGGGLGVQYNSDLAPSAKDFADATIPLLKETNCKIFIEPGRYLTADSGALVSKILFTKEHRNKNFLIIDAAVNDLLRPALYQAYHHILPMIQVNRDLVKYDVVGPVCETGDFLALDRPLQKMNREEHIAIMTSGAYGFVMSSNYNSRRRVPEIIVDDDKFYLAKERESYDDLVKNEKIIEELFK